MEISCPICSSKNVYSLMNSLRCKRCGNIWKEEKKNSSNFVNGEFESRINHQVWSITKNRENRIKNGKEIG